MYADDLVLVYSTDSMSNLEVLMNSDLQKIKTWSDKLKLTVNTVKTCYMIMNKDANSLLNINYNNIPIQKVLQFKHLGLNINYKLDWNLHVDKIKKKLAPIAGIFRKLQLILSPQAKRSLYYSFFSSHILYGINIWGSAYQYKIKELQTIQNRAIRNLFGHKYMTPTKLIHTENRILPVLELHKLTIVCLVHNITEKFIHSTTNISQRSDHHHHHTRNSANLHNETTRSSKYGTNSILQVAISCYNNCCPNSLKILNKNKFKTKYKIHVSDQYKL